MRSYYHIERDFAKIPMNFLWLEYHQIRFVSFAIWFLGLFLTDFTSISTNPTDGWSDLLKYFEAISIIHIIFVGVFELYLILRHFIDNDASSPTWKMIVQSIFDLSIHLDIAAILFSVLWKQTINSIYIIEVLVILDAILTFVLTPYKRWRGFIDLFGVFPSIILAHISIYKTINSILIFIPITIVLTSPIFFTICSIGFTSKVISSTAKFIKFIDPTLLPNSFINSSNFLIENNSEHNDSLNGHGENPPNINDRATSGDNSDYFDFKSFPFLIAATFFIHFGCFFQHTHSNTMIVMAHYFLMLGSFLINTRVVAFPAIIFTNVQDKSVQFNTVWPELSFV